MNTSASPALRPPLSAAFLLLPEFTLLAFTGFIEALRHAADRGDRSRQIHCKWTLLGTSLTPVRASCGIEVAPWEVLRPIPECEYLVVVGGLTWAHRHVPRELVDFIRRAYDDGTTIVGLCTASFILARAGILDTSRCCVHHLHLEEFRNMYPRVEPVADQIFIADRRVITCAGGNGTTDLALHLIEQHFGASVAAKVANQMVCDHWRAHNDPQARVATGVTPAVHDPIVQRALALVQYHLSAKLTVERLAAMLAISPRNLGRRFRAVMNMPPGRYIKDARVDLAEWLMTNTARTITEVAMDCGFSDVSHFARAYRHRRAAAPSEFRKFTSDGKAGARTQRDAQAHFSRLTSDVAAPEVDRSTTPHWNW
jgi:transcriptional regulator GlxA family with amidase domain